jgi:hypothetical protein
MPIYGTGSGPGSTAGVTTMDRSITVNARTAGFTVAELQLVMAQQMARERVGRPR